MFLAHSWREQLYGPARRTSAVLLSGLLFLANVMSRYYCSLVGYIASNRTGDILFQLQMGLELIQ